MQMNIGQIGFLAWLGCSHPILSVLQPGCFGQIIKSKSMCSWVSTQAARGKTKTFEAFCFLLSDI